MLPHACCLNLQVSDLSLEMQLHRGAGCGCHWKTQLGAAAGGAQVGGWRTIFGAALFPAVALGAGMVRFTDISNRSQETSM